MGRAVNLSPLGLYNWDQTIFDLMTIPSALNKNTLINNLLAETAELEVLYPNPVVFKNLVGVWSAKQLDIWNRLYETTQYEYNPIENYNRYETGSTDGNNTTTHSGTDSTTESTTYGGTNARSETITHGGKDTVTEDKEDGGTEVEEIEGHTELSGSDETEIEDTKGHWIAGFDSTGSGSNDGLVKQTRDQDDGTSTVNYGKIEDNTGTKTTTFGKTEDNTIETAYGKTETVSETNTYGQTIGKSGGLTHGENVVTSSEGEHTLHAHGNIGVTTTQKLIREQRAIELFNLYDIIIEDFKMRFCIMIY